MDEHPERNTASLFDEALRKRADQVYVFRLYVAGNTPSAARAIANIQRICEKILADHYDLSIFDVHQQPELAADNQVLAAPTLIRSSPLPERRLVGDMSDQARVLKGLDLPLPPSSDDA